MDFLWRRRRQLAPALKELGCGFATVLFVTAPLWVLTVAWRGPAYALAALAVLTLLLIVMVAVRRFFRRR